MTRFHTGGVEVEGAQESDLGATAAKFDAGLASLAVLWQGQQVFGVPVPVPGEWEWRGCEGGVPPPPSPCEQ